MEGRLLSAAERGIWLMDQTASLNGTIAAHVSGPVSAALLTTALARLIERHPLLSMRIEDGRNPRFVHDSDAQVPLRTCEGPDWRAELEVELNSTHPFGQAPLMRAVWVDLGPEEGVLLLSHHHIVSDAMSALVQVEEILADVGCLLAGELLPHRARRPLMPALDECLPSTMAGSHKIAAFRRFAVTQAQVRARGGPAKMKGAGDGSPGDRHTRVIHHVLDPDETTRLATRCREESTTVQGGLAAAVMLAVNPHLDRVGPAGCFSAVSLRHLLEPEPRLQRDDVGLYASQATTYHRPSVAGDPWDLAREIKTSLRSEIEGGQPFVTLPALGMFVPWFGDRVRKMARRVDNAQPAAFGVTNIGRLGTPSSFGPLRVRDIHFAICIGLVAPFAVAAVTFDSRLRINFMFVEPAVTPSRARDVADRCLGTLREML